MLTAEAISRCLGNNDRWQIEVCRCVDSTNRVLKEAAAAGAPAGRVLVAEMQTAGRGRMQRSFFSPDATGLYMSILLRPSMPAADAQLLTVAAAAAAAEAVEALIGRQVDIKWVNDLYLDGRKICGILTESALDPLTGRLVYAVVGIGVNLLLPPGGFPAEIADTAGTLFAVPPAEDPRAGLCAGILRAFSRYADRPEARAFLAPYRRRSFLIGRHVTLTPSGERVLVVGIDDDGRLCVLDAQGARRAVSSGECSVCPGE